MSYASYGRTINKEYKNICTDVQFNLSHCLHQSIQQVPTWEGGECVRDRRDNKDSKIFFIGSKKEGSEVKAVGDRHAS